MQKQLEEHQAPAQLRKKGLFAPQCIITVIRHVHPSPGKACFLAHDVIGKGNNFWEYSLLTGPIQERPQVLNPLKAELSLPGFCCLLEQPLAVCLQSDSRLLKSPNQCINRMGPPQHPTQNSSRQEHQAPQMKARVPHAWCFQGVQHLT